MKILLASLLITFTFNNAFANCTDIEGQWVMQQEINGVTIDTTLTVTKESSTVVNVCSGLGKTTTSQVVAKSSYTDFVLTILETKSDKVSNGDLSCQSELKAEALSYSMVGNFLILNQASGAQIYLTRK